MKKTGFLFLGMLLMIAITSCSSFKVDNLNYVMAGDSTSVSIASNQDKTLSGDLVIPDSIHYNGNTYVVTSISRSAFSNCKALTSVVISNYVTSIGDSAFGSCSSLASITLSSSLMTIGDAAFVSCDSLSSVTIPESVTSIGSRTFEGCTGLRKVICFSETPPVIGEGCFNEVDMELCTLYVPMSVKDSYGAAEGWSLFRKTSSGISENGVIIENPVSFFTEQDAIVVKGAKEGDVITVYTASGVQVQTLTSDGNDQRISVPARAIYIVKVGDQTSKVAL